MTHRIVEHYRVGSLDVAGDLVGLGEDHLGHVVGVGANLELARLKIITGGKYLLTATLMTEEFLHHLRVQGEVVKPHRADEVDVGGLQSMTHDMTLCDMTWYDTCEYMISFSLVIHSPACLDSTLTT